MSEDIRSDPVSEPVCGRLFSVGSPMVATLASIAAHAAVVVIFLFPDTTSVELGEIVVVDLVISEDESETAHPPSIDAAGAEAETADDTNAHADEAGPALPMGGKTTVAFPAPGPPATAVPQSVPPPMERPETVAEAVPLPPRRPQRMRPAPPEPPETTPAAEALRHETVPMGNGAGEASDPDPTKTGRPDDRGDPTSLSAEPAPTPDSAVGRQTTRDESTEQAAVYGGPVKAAPREGNPRPPYPARAIRRGWQGRVVLDVEVLPTGAVGEIKIETSSGYRILDRAALKTVRQWRFRPAKIAGSPVRARAQVPVLFKLTR